MNFQLNLSADVRNMLIADQQLSEWCKQNIFE